MARTANTQSNNNVLLVSDNLNYLCVRAKEFMENEKTDNLEIIYDSILNTKDKKTSMNFDGVEVTLNKMRDLLGTSTYRTISIKGINTENNSSMEDKSESKTKSKEKENKNDVSENSNSDNDSVKEDNGGGRRGAPSLSQEVLDFRYDVISDYDEDKITSEEAIQKLGVTEGVFRNLVSEFHRCKKAGRRKAFGKTGIIKRTYKLYSENKISSARAAENIGVSVATFLNWYKHDTGTEEIGRGTKRVKNK